MVTMMADCHAIRKVEQRKCHLTQVSNKLCIANILVHASMDSFVTGDARQWAASLWL